MASTRTTSKGIRISNEAAEYFSDKPLNRMVEQLMELMRSGMVGFDGESLKITGSEGVHIENEVMRSIREMLGFSGMTFDDLLKDINEKLESGELMLDEGCTRVQMPAWAEEFEEACHDLCIPVEKAAESAIKALKKG